MKTLTYNVLVGVRTFSRQTLWDARAIRGDFHISDTILSDSIGEESGKR